jgi:hypothetical protein
MDSVSLQILSQSNQELTWIKNIALAGWEILEDRSAIIVTTVITDIFVIFDITYIAPECPDECLIRGKKVPYKKMEGNEFSNRVN